MEGLRVFCSEKLPTSHIFLTRLSVRLYWIRLVNHCAHFAPIIALTLQRQPSYRTKTCAPCGCSHRCEALSPEPQRPSELTSPRSSSFPRRNHPTGIHGSPGSTGSSLTVSWLQYMYMCKCVKFMEYHGIRKKMKKTTTNCTLHSGHHRILSHVLLQCLVNPSTAPRWGGGWRTHFLRDSWGIQMHPRKKNNRWIDFEITVLDVFMSLNFAFLES